MSEPSRLTNAMKATLLTLQSTFLSALGGKPNLSIRRGVTRSALTYFGNKAAAPPALANDDGGDGALEVGVE